MDSALLIIAGLVGLLFGGEFLVRGAVDIARRFGLSPLVIGLTLVGFGTSTPELVTSIQAAFLGSPGIAFGNVVGSNIANILLVLGFAAALAPIAIARKAFLRDGSALALSAMMCLGVVLFGSLSLVIGVVFLTGLALYLIYTVRDEHQGVPTEGDASAEAAPASPTGHVWKDLAFVVAGMMLTVFGAKFLVEGAIEVAASFGVSEAVIGLTIVAVGTSLPELVTTIAAARRGASDIAFGNVVGSNIFNVLFILGATAIIHPIDVPQSIATFDIWVMLGVTALLLGMGVTRWRIGRIEGYLLLICYVGYMSWLGITSVA